MTKTEFAIAVLMRRKHEKSVVSDRDIPAVDYESDRVASCSMQTKSDAPKRYWGGRLSRTRSR